MINISKHIVLYCLISILASLPLQSQETISVCSQNCDFKKIQQAVDAAKEGDSIFIKKGIYKENDIFINQKSLHIYGEEGSIIDIQEKGYGFKVEASNFSLKNLKIINTKVSYTTDYASVYLFKCENFVIDNITLENAFFGFLIEKSKAGKVLNNTVSGKGTSEANSGNAIHFWHSKNIETIGNEVFEMRDGIYIEFGNNMIFENNHSYENMRYGLHFMFSHENRYSHNVFERNSAGVAVMFSRKLKMNNNVFKKNWGSSSYGLLLKEINDAELFHNIFLDNTIGINIDGATRINYTQNNFKNNGYALKFIGGSYENHFKENNFMYNTFDLSYSGQINNNRFQNNYWSEYTGYDLNRDGVGDVPYRPVKLFSYIVNKTPETIILLRSLFVDLIDFSEKVSPIFTPKNLTDDKPLMQEITW